MSRAGKLSSQGDEYQLQIGLHWLIRLLEDESIDFIQIESTGVPNLEEPVTVDDVVIFYKDGRAGFVQAKKNHPQYTNWTLNAIGDELRKAALQVSVHKNCLIIFYSQSPWGKVQSLVEGCKVYPDYTAFQNALDVSIKIKELLATLSEIMNQTESEAFRLACSISFGEPFNNEKWEEQNLIALTRIIPRASLGIDVLRELLSRHQINLPGAPFTLTREAIINALTDKGLAPTPIRSETEILNTFRSSSAIGRFDILREIDGQRIFRLESDKILGLIKEGVRSILLTSGPGSGKTCLMFDLADRIEDERIWGLLFIKGDRFADITSEQNLTNLGLPNDIVGQCARLAEYRKVVVLIDSLDVLSLNRNHKVLSIFLGLMDRLGRLDDITAVVSCRTFDLTYDPMLQGRKWDHIIEVTPLDYDSVVAPFLKKWGVDEKEIGKELRELLRIPRNLSLFEQLIKVNRNLNLRTSHDLHDRYLEEVVLKGDDLGREAMNILEKMADECMRHRKLSIPKSALCSDDDLLQRLASVNALTLSPDGQVGFHQTMGECLAVRHALSQGKSLKDFILDHPQLPFIRPAVRAYFFNLRVHDQVEFRRQVTAVLTNQDILYHLKRLISESLGEIVPAQDDVPLILRLFKINSELFQRMLWHVTGDAWLDILTTHWLPVALGRDDKEKWLIEFAGRLRVWVNQFPEQVISLWLTILEQSSRPEHISWEIIRGLDKFEHWTIKGIEELLRKISTDQKRNHDFRLKPISMWVDATGEGDKFLWEVMTQGIIVEDMREINLKNKLFYKEHHFYRKEFIKDRLKKSDELLSLALGSLITWCNASPYGPTKSGIDTSFLADSSWRYIHTSHDTNSYDDLECFLDDLEAAIRYRAKNNDAWWRENEPGLRNTPYAVLRLFLIRGYLENIEKNIKGIETILQDESLFRYSQLEYELGELIQHSYPIISEEIREANQLMIHSLYADKEGDEESKWVYHHRYEYLLKIPCIFRTEQTQTFLDYWSPTFGTYPPVPRLHSWGGFVGSPVSVDQMLELSDNSIIRLLMHYNDSYDRDETIAGRLIGGRSNIEMVLSRSASRNPIRFLALFPSIKSAELVPGYFQSILRGISDHLKYRFGNLSPDKNWIPIEPLPDGIELAKTLLQLLESEYALLVDETTLIWSIEPCCHILTDETSVKHIVILFQKAIKALADKPEEDENDLRTQALNSPLGIIAESAMILADNLLESNKPLPSELLEVIFSLAQLPNEYIKVSILPHLHFAIFKSPDIGWRLFDILVVDVTPKVWPHTERCLYYNYHNHFDRIEPCLDRIYNHAMDQAGETWGRISTLAYLSGHISKDNLFITLEKANEQKAWKGAIQVFSSNIDESNLYKICTDGLLETLSRAPLTSELMGEISAVFVKEKNRSLVSKELALLYLQKVQEVKGSCGLFHFLEWLPFEAKRDPISAMEILETLAKVIEEKPDRSELHLHKEGITSAFMQILREADEYNDPELLQRIIVLQDKFLMMGLDYIETLYEQSTM
jgi:hypothetical protein